MAVFDDDKKRHSETSVVFLLVSGGAAWNFENFEAPDITDRNSFEAYLGTEYNLFDFSDLDVNTTIYAYPGITEKGRFRTDFNLNVKYDFPLDFFINIGFAINYDNKSVQGASASDYVLQTTIGWEL